MAMILPATSSIVCLAAQKTNPPPKILAEDEKQAKAHHYVQDSTKSDPAVRGEGWTKEQKCRNCSFYKASVGEYKDALGECDMFSKGLVKAEGWCIAWAAPS